MKRAKTKHNESGGHQIDGKSKEINPGDLIKELNKYFMVKHSPKIIEFWQHAVNLNGQSPTEAFTELFSLNLVGPFDLLNDLRNMKTSQKDEDYIISHRFSTDLPEMQTIMLYRGGRFCYWRDDPNEHPEYLIHVSNEPKNFPIFTIVGDQNPYCALAYLLMQSKKSADNLFPNSFDSAKYDQKFLNELRKKRNNNSIGKPFHGLGIKVVINEKDVGYRPVTEDTKRLKRNIELMGTTDSEAERKTLKEELFKIYSYVQFANDEMDFGMGLEFGHDLFISNYQCFDGMTRSVLSMAYGLLNREVYAKILEKHWEYGRRRNDDKLFN